jgi:hypothetical protein
MEGYVHITPKIKKISFEIVGKISVYLEDGRVILAPLSKFPSLKKVPSAKRSKYTIVNGDVVNVHACNEVYHLQDFLGLPENYVYKG